MSKRTASEAFAESSRSRSPSRPRKRGQYGLPHPPNPPISPRASPTPELDEEETIDESEDPILYRILAGLEYTRTQHAQGEPVLQTTRFAIKEQEHLSLMHQAHKEGHSTRIATSSLDGDTYEVWEIGVPRPDWVTEGAFGGVHDPQWFHGKDAAQIRAGPLATQDEVKRAQAVLKGAETRWTRRPRKSQRKQEIDWKLEEGRRRQKHGLKMNDSDDGDAVDSLPDPSASDRSTSSSDDSDDQPLIQRSTKWRAAQRTQSTVTSSTATRRGRSISSNDPDASKPSASSNTNNSDKVPHRSSQRIKNRSIRRSSNSSDRGSLITDRRKKRAVQQNRPEVESSNDITSRQNDSEDDVPLLPVFSRWKAARQSPHGKSSQDASRRISSGDTKPVSARRLRR